jgi:pimeloyl-ACP methyl ester carboxylesterase
VSNFNDLIEISGCDNPSRRGDVIFVHGLGGTARGTWHPLEKQDDDNFWCAWLGEDLPDVGIWSLGYEVEPFRWKGNSMPLSDRATNSLDLLDSYEIGDRPIIFITHSMGGLLVKQMLRSARDFGRWSAIASQTKGIVFLSTPHSGSDMASWIKHIGKILQTTVSVEELEAHHSRLRELNLLYRNDDLFSQIPMLVYCETRPTKGILVVNQTSADPGIKGVIPVPMDFDHISICKVVDRKSQIYRQVKRFIDKNLPTHSAPTPDLTIQPPPIKANQPMKREQVFISYSHKDKVWLDKLQTMLKPLMRNKTISVWDDTKIQAGVKWKAEIENALAAANVAVLMVSSDFLASDFIAEHELPPLLAAAEKEGVKIIWIPVTFCLYDETEIADYQAAHNPNQPLDGLSPTELNQVLVKICRQIKAAATGLSLNP